MDSFHPVASAKKTSLRLSVAREHVADACRTSIISFLADVAPVGSGRALGSWLLASYAGAVLPSSRRETPSLRLDRGRLTEIIDDARVRVAYTMRSLESPEVGMHFSMHAVHSGWAVQFEDLNGQPGWMPIDLPRMRLTDRVLSLVAADYMARSLSYQHGLHLCDTCDSADFFAPSEADRACSRCARTSGIDFTAIPSRHARVA